MKLRTGRHNKQLVYVQQGDEPSNDDRLFGVFFTEEDAQTVVARADVFQQLRDNLGAITSIEVGRPYYGGKYVLHRRSQIEAWLDEMEENRG